MLLLRGMVGWKVRARAEFLTNLVPSPKEILGLVLYCGFEEVKEGRKNGPRPFSFSIIQKPKGGKRREKNLQKQALSLPNRFFGIIHHVPNTKDLSQSLEECHVGPPPFLETEIADCVRPDEILHRRRQERERGFEVDAVGGEENVRMGRDDGRRPRRDGMGGAAPGEDGRVYRREEGWVEGDVFLD